jgi:membrane fusion protein, multidrug efflux system
MSHLKFLLNFLSFERVTYLLVDLKMSPYRLVIYGIFCLVLSVVSLGVYATSGGAQSPANQAAASKDRAVGERPPVSVKVVQVEQKAMPVRLDAIGTVQPISSVTLRSRVDSQIMEVAFQDGASVKAGDVLFRLDARQIEAQVRQAEATIARDRAALTLAEADLQRAISLAKRDFGTEQRLDTTRSNVAALKASIRGNEAALESLKVQQTYYTLTAPISGRIGVAGLKAGNIARVNDNTNVLATLNQMKPIYVAFSLPQRHLPEVQLAVKNKTAKVLATPQGFTDGVQGLVSVIDNAVDPLTGTLQIRATFENADEVLWPGALCQVRLTLRTDANALVVPREAVLFSQTGNIVFVVEEGVAKARIVTLNRTIDNEVVIDSGLSKGESIIVDGQSLLNEGSKVRVRENAPAAQKPEAAPSLVPAPPSSQPRPNAG